MKFLGHMVDGNGIVPLPRHVEAIQEFPPPADIKQPQQFLGLVSFYRRFLPSAARTLKPLTDLLRGNPKRLEWSPDAQSSFLVAKAALVAAVPLTHPAPGATLALAVDASDTHVGAALQQLEYGAWRPLAFFSRKLTVTETRYSTFDRELLAAFAAVRHFRFLLEGRQFRLLTDHKPLVSALARVSPPWSARQHRQLAFLSEFTSDIRHTPGHANVVADELLRPPPAQQAASNRSVAEKTAAALHATIAEPPLPPANQQRAAQLPPALDFAAVAAAQASCPDVSAMRNSSLLQTVQRPVGGVQLLGDISTGVFRPFLPTQFRQAAIKSLHEVHHPGVRATCRLVSAAFCWPHMKKQTATAARSCLGCQRGKTHHHVHLQPEHIPVPHRRFVHLHVDLVKPLPQSAGMTYMFTMVDRTTRWPEVIPLSSTTAADCAEALLAGWIQRFGVPSTITSDRGPQFTSAVWSALCSLLNITRSTTTAYHPQSNGIVERFHRRLKDALRARAAGADWVKHMPWVLLGIRSAWRDDSSFSPADAVYGSQPLLPGQFLDLPENPSPPFIADFQGVLAGQSPTSTTHHSSPEPVALPEDLLLSRYVLVRRDGHQPPLSPAYDGPYLVLECSLRFFKLKIGGRTDNISTLRLKPCHTPPDAQVEVANPPRRGRPPKKGLPTTPPALQHPAPTLGHPPPPPSRKRVTFRCQVASPTPPPRFHPSGRPARTTARPASYAI